jgi:iron complex transport system substrate-binding protein
LIGASDDMTRRSWIVVLAAVFGVTGLIVWRWCVPAVPEAGPAPPAEAKPRQIVSLTLATDEMLAELVPAERVAAVSYLADDPELSNVRGRYPPQIPRVRAADVERVLALAPDLVCVAPYTTADALKLLERSGLALYRNNAVHSFDEIEAGIRQLGERVGEPGRAGAVAQRMQSRRRALARHLKDVPDRPRVLFWSAGFTAGRDTTLDDVIREAGGVNVATALGLEGDVEIAPERVTAADPDVVLVAGWSEEERQGRIDRHPILRQLRAMREGHVITIEGRYLSSVSQFAIEGAERLARRLHPGRFSGEGSP